MAGAASSRGTLDDSYLLLYRGSPANATLVTQNDDDGPGFDSLIYRYQITANDVCYIQAIPYSSSHTGTYDLGVWLEDSGTPPTIGGTVSSETEPNNSAVTGNDVSSSWQKVGYLSARQRQSPPVTRISISTTFKRAIW